MKLYFKAFTKLGAESEYVSIDIDNRCFTHQIVLPDNFYMELDIGDYRKLINKLIKEGYSPNWYR